MPDHIASTRPDAPRRATLSRNGRNQALPIPRELDDHLIVEPAARRRSLAEILPGLNLLTEDFSETSDPPVRPEDVL